MKKLKNTIGLLFVLCMFIINISIFSSENSSPVYKSSDKLIKELNILIPELMDKALIPGLSIAVINDGKIIWHKDFGVLNTKTGTKAVLNSVYQAASLTKTLFAFLVMKMVEKGELDLNVPLIKYLPKKKIEKFLTHSIDMKNFKNEWLKKITVSHVLSHSSGFAHGYAGVVTPYPLKFEPGTKFSYSADGYSFLQLVVEHIKGETLDKIMKREVIEPLNMTNSNMKWQDRFENKTAAGHDMFGETNGDVYKDFGASAAAGLFTTAEDYAKFILAIINNKVISRETALAMLNPQVKINDQVGWANGCAIDKTDDGDIFWQTGDFGVFKHYATGIKEKKLGFVYLTNSSNGLSIVKNLYQKIIGKGTLPGISWMGYPQHDSASLKLIREMVKNGIEKAKILYRELRNVQPESVSEKKISSLAFTLMGSKKYNEAIQLIKECMKFNQKSIRLNSALASAYYRKGDDNSSIETYKKIIQLKPDHKVAARYINLIELIQIIKKNGFKPGKIYYNELRIKNKKEYSERNLSRFGNRLLRAGRIDESILIFKLNLSCNMKSSNANLDLGDAYAAKNNKELALKFIKKALEISPGNGWAKMSLKRLKKK